MPLKSLSARLPAARTWLPPQRGLVGVDIGTRSIKLAQVERVGQRWEIASRWMLPLEDPVQTPDAEWLRKSLAAARHELEDLRGIFVGRRAAVSLPMSLTSLRCLEVPDASPHEVRAMAFDELADEFGGRTDFRFDLWDLATRSRGGDQVRHLTTLSTPDATASCVAEGLLAAGYECHILDAAPCALARCVQLATPQGSDEPAVAIDLGYHSPYFVLCRGGRPSFCRSLPDCGLRSIMQPLRERLQLTERQCQPLLTRLGVAAQAGGAGGSDPGNGGPGNSGPGNNGPASHGPARAISQLLAPRLAHVAGEIERTLDYVNQQFRDQYPKRMWLFGGGACVGNFAELLAARTGIPTEPWSVPDDHERIGREADAPFAVAAALSLLAWEDASCT